MAIFVYVMLYGKKSKIRLRHTRIACTRSVAVVTSSVYSCIAVVAYLSLNFALRLLDLERWEPFALSVFFVITALLASMGVVAPLRQQERDGFDSDGRLTRSPTDQTSLATTTSSTRAGMRSTHICLAAQ
jgi:hypothetical protein